MAEVEALTSFKQGVQLLKGGYPQRALVELRRCVEIESANPYYLSFLGLAIARAERKMGRSHEIVRDRATDEAKRIATPSEYGRGLCLRRPPRECD